jgi:acyl-CoA thioester hydrolase
VTSPRRFEHRIRVRYHEVDRMGVIYHPIFVRYFENARIELLRDLGFPHRRMEDSGAWFVVANLSIAYLANTGYDAELTVETTVARVRQASVEFAYRVFEGERLLARGRVELACTDGKGGIVRIPDPLRQALKECEGNVEN